MFLSISAKFMNGWKSTVYIHNKVVQFGWSVELIYMKAYRRLVNNDNGSPNNLPAVIDCKMVKLLPYLVV